MGTIDTCDVWAVDVVGVGVRVVVVDDGDGDELVLSVVDDVVDVDVVVG